MAAREAIAEAFQRVFGRTPSVYAHAPGRVNLIGEHTDYNQGFVFPAAINFGTDVAAAGRDDEQVCVAALDFKGQISCFHLNDIAFDRAQPWSNYVRGVLKILQTRHAVGGADLVITGDVPQGAGLSSSASLEMAVISAFAQLYSLPLNGVDAALIGQRAENEFVGCACGIMDQLVSAMGKQGHALLLDCQSLSIQHQPIAADYRIVIVNSNVQRGLVGSEYNLRRQQCEQAAHALGVASLRDADLERLNRHHPVLPDAVYRRARHVITENQRTLDMRDALAASDYRAVKALMAASHRSMQRDFEITVPAVDELVDIIGEAVGDFGGVRMTGGGFGGCVVALVPADRVDPIRTAVAQQYRLKTGLEPSFYVCTAEQGAFATGD